MILHIIEAKYIKDYEVEVKFNDGRTGVADLTSELRGSVFQPLKDKSLFSQLRESCLMQEEPEERVIEKAIETIIIGG